MRSISMKLWLLAAMSSLLQLLPFPFRGPLPSWGPYFAWVCLLPLMICVHLPGRGGKSLQWWHLAALGWLNGTAWWAVHCYWVYETFRLYGGVPPTAGVGIQLILSGILGINIAIFTALLLILNRFFVRHLWAMPLSAGFLWVAIELFRARLLGVPWDQLGMSQVDNPILMHLPPWTGVYGVSFLIVVVNGLLAQGFAAGDRRKRAGLVVAGLVVALVVQPWAITRRIAPELFPAEVEATASAVLLQQNLNVGGGDVDGSNKTVSLDQMLEEFVEESESPSVAALREIPGSIGNPVKAVTAASIGSVELGEATTHSVTMTPAVIVWPESPAPFFSNNAEFRHWLSALATDAHSALIVGSVGVSPAPDLPRGYRVYNSANFVGPDGKFDGRYDKIHLVPFGEYVPFRRELFFVRSLTAQLGDMDRGTVRLPFVTGGHSYGTFICYEDAFANEVRQFAKAGADVLVTISDDGWYGDSGAAWQHLNLARMRAIENDRWLLRDTNTGITAAIDPNGVVREAEARQVRVAAVMHFGYVRGTTFYTRHGDWFGYGCVLGVLVMIALGQQVRFAEYLHRVKALRAD